MNLLYLDNIYKAYDEKDVLNGLNLDINKGEIVFLVGPNGAGKTTLVKIILGLSRPDEGTVLLNSKELRVPFSNTDKLCLGYVPDEPIFIEYLTGLENLKYYCKLYKKNSSNEHLLSIMKAYDIYSSADKFVKDYSRGMRQKLSLCFIDIIHPELIIMDEPTIGLDIISIDYLREHITKLKEKGHSLLITTHDMAFCQGIADNIYILNNGKTSKLNKDYTNETNALLFKNKILDNIK